MVSIGHDLSSFSYSGRGRFLAPALLVAQFAPGSLHGQSGESRAAQSVRVSRFVSFHAILRLDQATGSGRSMTNPVILAVGRRGH